MECWTGLSNTGTSGVDSLFYTKARRGETDILGRNQVMSAGSRALRGDLELER